MKYIKNYENNIDTLKSFTLSENFSRRNFLKSSIASVLTGLTAGTYCSKKERPSIEKNLSGKQHHLSRESKNIHSRWNKDIPPILRINSGDIVTIETKDASDDQFTQNSTSQDIAKIDSSRVHALSGPIYIEEAKPGNVLQVDILKIELSDWGWIAVSKEAGFLKEGSPQDYFKILKYDENKKYVDFKEGIRIKLEPFCGVMGVAWDEPGEFRTFPPRKSGGNMDNKHLTAGTTLYLPISLNGALFSVGDGHAAQGDGEVCTSAIETALTVTLRISVRTDISIDEPQYESNEFYATTGFGTTIEEAAIKATRFMIKRLTKNYGLSPEEAYTLCSVVMDLKISEVVDMPHYLVSAHIPKNIFIRS